MKKRFATLLLCVLMIASLVLSSGCSVASDTGTTDSSGSEEEAVTTRSNMTLSLWIPTDENTTKEAIDKVEIAINSVTQREFDTAIKLYAVPTDEYDALMKDRLALMDTRKKEEAQAELDRIQAQLQAAQRGEEYVEETTISTENPNMDGDYSLVPLNSAGYDSIKKTQLDIFLIRGEEDYKYYANNYYIEDLRSHITGASKKLSTYIYPSFFEAATVDGGIYGIPNNHPVGEYTYFLVNKDLVEKEYLNPDKLLSLSDCQAFIEDVAEFRKDEVDAIVYGDYSPSYYNYWNGSENPDQFSVLASRVLYSTTAEDVEFKNIFSIPNFVNNFYLYKLFTEKGYVNKSETVPNSFAVGYITCSAEEIAKYEDDYYINVYKYPKGTNDEYLESVFAVSKFTKDIDRSMEIITLLNTSTELRTILQYGAEGTHWKYDEEDSNIIVKLSDDYKMNLNETGNVYMTYPDYGVSMKLWDSAKDQNADSYYSPVLSFPSYVNDANKNLFKDLDKLSADIMKRINAMTADEFKANVSKFESEVATKEFFKQLIHIPSDSDKGKPAEKYDPNASIANLWNETFGLAEEE